MAHLSVIFQENSTLRELYLGHNYFREAGGEQIAEGLGRFLNVYVFKNIL